MSEPDAGASPRRRLLAGFAAWLAILAVDLFVHGALLAEVYLQPSPFLLPPGLAFARIPIGYLSFLILVGLLVWLMVRLKTEGWRSGLVFGLALGALVGGAAFLGLYSITTADPVWLVVSFIGQTVELGLAGAIVGGALGGARLGRIYLWVVLLVVVSVVATVVLQSFDIVPIRTI